MTRPSKPYKVKKEDLIALVSKYQQRTFSEDIDYLEQLGGDAIFEDILAVDYTNGVQSSEVRDRRARYGSAELDEGRINFLKLIWSVFESFTVRILLIAAIVSIIVNTTVDNDNREKGWIEGVSILVLMLVYSIISVIHYQKEDQLRRLKETADLRKQFVDVWRDGRPISIHKSELITGDIVRIYDGLEIPADMLMLEGNGIIVDESMWTGEHDGVKKKIFARCLAERDEIIASGERYNSKSKNVSSPILLSGTNVWDGEGKAIVLVVGEFAAISEIKKYMVEEPEITPLQDKLEKLSIRLSQIGLISAIVIFLILLIRFLIDRAKTDTFNDGQQYVQLIEFVLIAVTVFLVAAPEDLVTTFSVSLAYSIKKMIYHNSLAKDLSATETMGTVNSICTDATGTLTQNKLYLTHFWNDKHTPIDVYAQNKLSIYFPEQEFQELIRQALGCNTSASLTPTEGSKSDIAFLEFLEKNGEDYRTIREKYVTENSIKFDFSSRRKRTSTVLENVENGTNSKKRMHIKGNSDIILEACDKFFSFGLGKTLAMTPELKEKIENEVEKMSDLALRTVCIGYKEINGDEDFVTKDDRDVYDIEKSGFTLLGVLGVRDMLRKDTKEAVAQCRRAGIKVRMLTGGNETFARIIAQECRIIADDENSTVITGPDFIELTGGIVCRNCRIAYCECPRSEQEAKRKGKEMRVDTIANGEAFNKIYRNLDVIARGTPLHKYTLVVGLKERGEVVAVTGDGTGDGPPLKKADVGLAAGSGTDCAKDAAGIILLDDSFASIVKAAMFGRNIQDNIRRFIQFQLTVSFVVIVMTIIGVAGLRQPILSPVQLLWVKLIMDIFVSFALVTERPSNDLLERHPYDRNDPIVSKSMMKHAIGQALYQLVLMMVLAFTADQWVPESLGPESMPVAGYEDLDRYRSDGVHVRSGRTYFISDVGKDYGRFSSVIGPSRHFTLVFNTFMFCQIFNFINCRKIRQELNVFSGISKNYIFITLLVVIIGLQPIVGNLGGIPFDVSFQGIDIAQWLITIGLAAFTLVWSLILKFIAFERIFSK